MPPTTVSVIIPNFNGRALLERNLPSVLAAAREQGRTEVVVVDDGSKDGSLSALAARFPEARVLPLEEHAGFIAAVNHGVGEAQGEAVVLLNSDVQVEPDFIGPLVEGLDEQTFAVSARSLTEEGLNEGISLAFFEEGDLVVVQPGIEAPDDRHRRRCTNFHASGGFSAFHRDKFVALGGLDPLYHPFYWEDVDLCYRAWKRGWRCVYEPRSLVHHISHSTISCYFSAQEVAAIYETNKHSFMLKNISDPDLLARYLERLSRVLFTPPQTAEQTRRYRGAFELLRRARQVLARRRRDGGASDRGELSDAEVLRLSANVPC